MIMVIVIVGFCAGGAWADELREAVAEMTRGTGVVEIVAPQQDDRVREGIDRVPVQFPSIAVLRPFQRLVATYGVPRYEEVEPSLFVALSFVLMFGLMFGDVGQGAVIATRPANAPFIPIERSGFPNTFQTAIIAVIPPIAAARFASFFRRCLSFSWAK